MENKFKIKMAIRAIILAEKLFQKPFGKFNFSTNEDMTGFLYCLVLVNNDTRMLLGEFQSVMQANAKLRAELLDEFQTESKKIAQFQKFTNEVKPEKDSNEVGGFVKDIAWFLIIQGKLDASYVMEQMDISDIPNAVDAINQVKRESLESRRLWTFLTMLPHMDSKKVKTPQDIYPFPWEIEQLEAKAKKDLEDNSQIFEEFMSGKMKFDFNK